MPNWCHNVLTVEADDPADLAAFVEAVREDVSEERLRADFADADRFGEPEETYEQYAERRRARRAPLSFDRIAPFDPEEWPTTYRTCFVCGGTGERPGALEQFGADWIAWCNGCNGCNGTGQSVDEPGWRRHHCSEWGTKWDASFHGPFMALGREGMDLDACVEANGLVVTPTTAAYRFDTAWSPPLAAVEKASEQHRSLTFSLRFGDPGSGEAGVVRYVAGAQVEQEELDVEDVLAPEEMWF